MSGEIQELGPEIRDPLFRALEANEDRPAIPFFICKHSRPTSTSAEKLELLETNTSLIDLLGDAGVLSGQGRVDFLVSRTLTAKAPGGEQFLVTTFGPNNLSTLEKRILLSILDYPATENEMYPSGKLAKRTEFGARSGVELESLGLAPGFVGPFLRKSVIPNIIIDRVLYLGDYFFEEPHHRVIDFALSPLESLLVPYGAELTLIKSYCDQLGINYNIVNGSDTPVFGPVEP